MCDEHTVEGRDHRRAPLVQYADLFRTKERRMGNAKIIPFMIELPREHSHSFGITVVAHLESSKKFKVS